MCWSGGFFDHDFELGWGDWAGGGEVVMVLNYLIKTYDVDFFQKSSVSSRLLTTG